MHPKTDPTDRLLKLLFQRTVRGVLASSTLIAGACGQTHLAGEEEPLDSSWRAPSCEDGHWQLAPNVKPAFPADYFGHLETYDDGDGGVRTWEMSETGSACANASDPEACRSQVEAARSALGRNDDYLLTTEGDLVEAWVTTQDKLAVLGQIDTHDEALWVNQLTNNDWVVCYDEERAIERGGVREVEGGYEVRSTRDRCNTYDDEQAERRVFFVDRDGNITDTGEVEIIETTEGCPIPGRRPPGLCERLRVRRTSALGRHFAREAHFEAASVGAFRVLAHELKALGAPAVLVRRARRAAREEVRHARQMRGLARRYGGVYAPPSIQSQPLRDLESIALDNAVEGCVNETYAALTATYQAARASDREVARVMAQIASDETGHAGFSLQLAAWAESQLDRTARARLRHAQRRAVQRLREKLTTEPDGQLRVVAGLPSKDHAHRLLDGLERSLLA